MLLTTDILFDCRLLRIFFDPAVRAIVIFLPDFVLHLPHVVVSAALRHQLGMCSLLGDESVREENDQVGIGDRFQPVSDGARNQLCSSAPFCKVAGASIGHRRYCEDGSAPMCDKD